MVPVLKSLASAATGSNRQQQAACRTAMRFLVGIKQVGGGTEHHWPHPHLQQPVVNL